MKIKIEELSELQLDYAVAIAEGHKPVTCYPHAVMILLPNAPRTLPFRPSQDWSDGGPIIERERIIVVPRGALAGWIAIHSGSVSSFVGPTLLIAAMRCFVAVKLGMKIDIPKELYS